ncbi:MAG: electron transfer flavoprotein subunit beta/FixA family protein [Planctomycetota bacterium]|nr:electron transfer flavoprotein subunit beta/FixA family protein [Planctomycetota bacterium]
MKVLVTLKRTPHRDARMRLGPDGELRTGDELKYEVNPFDELAVEQALVLQETRQAETVVVTVGGEECRQQLVTALAMGIDRAVRVDVSDDLDSLQVARCLAAVIRREVPDLVLSGKLAVDDENGQVPSMVAGLLGWPIATQASSMEFAAGGALRVHCEVDSGIDEVELELPAVVTTDLRLNEPRYASLPGIMKAKKKPVDVLSLADVGLEGMGSGRTRVLEYRALPVREKGVIVDSPEALVQALVARKLI